MKTAEISCSCFDGEAAGGNIFQPNVLQPHIDWFNDTQTIAAGSITENISMGSVSAFLHYMAFAALINDGNTAAWLTKQRDYTKNQNLSISAADLKAMLAVDIGQNS